MEERGGGGRGMWVGRGGKRSVLGRRVRGRRMGRRRVRRKSVWRRMCGAGWVEEECGKKYVEKSVWRGVWRGVCGGEWVEENVREGECEEEGVSGGECGKENAWGRMWMEGWRAHSGAAKQRKGAKSKTVDREG